MPVNKLFDYPYSSFLMLRREFEIFCQEQDLEVKILRVIEMYVENERTRLFQLQANRSKTLIDKIEIPRDVWVSISYNLFRSEIYDEKISDNTLKAAIKSLEAKKLIQKQYAPKKKYDSITYRLQVHVIDILNGFLRISGGQKLIPSKIDTLKNLPPQFLTPSFLSTIEDLRVSKIDTNSNKGNVYEERVCSNQPLQPDTLPQPNITRTPPAVAGDYENTAPSMQLSTATEQSVDNSHSENGSQSYSHKPTTSVPTHVGVMPVLAVPLPPGAKMPDAPAQPLPSAELDEKKRLGLIAELIRERAPQVSGVTVPVLKFLDAWDREKYGPCALVAWEVSSAKEIVTRHRGTVEDALLLADYLKAKGKEIRLELICGVWNKLSDLKKPVAPPYQPKAFNADDLPKDVWA